MEHFALSANKTVTHFLLDCCYFQQNDLRKDKVRSLHPWVKVNQAGRPLPPKSLNILVGLTMKLDSLCIKVIVDENHLDVLVCF